MEVERQRYGGSYIKDGAHGLAEYKRGRDWRWGVQSVVIDMFAQGHPAAPLTACKKNVLRVVVKLARSVRMVKFENVCESNKG